ncbi:MarR family EPS-associated transcriptional regulator [Altererythrobacter litoralis]|uniref:MarR family EPS-associated transcriptional regulator n=1 Tax=Altererythrobacter litoralis TaxID=3113904 RepID=A0ABU7GFD2_9SPHN|nr:MarR family EPS-associated transcriptional regulator [Erythrobacteraceae bacterium 1XM1-14]
MQEDTRTRVLRLIADNPQMTQRELADAVGISTGSVHYLLNALLEAGLVKFGNFSASQDKRRYAYILTPKGVAEKAALTHRFLKRKMQEYEDLAREIDALEEEMSQEGSASGQALSGTPTRNR